MTSIHFHFAANAAEPSAVIRLTAWAGGSDGGMIGAGGGTACAHEADGVSNDQAASAMQAASRLAFERCIFNPPCCCYPEARM